MTKEIKWLFFTVTAFALGICAGGLYCALMSSDGQVYEYLQSFISQIKEGTDKYGIFKKSLITDIKPVILIFVCALMRFGFIPVFAVCGIRGFYTGFTYAALFKYFGNKGLLLILSQLPAELLFFAAVTLSGAVCAYLSVSRKSRGAYAFFGAAFAAAVVIVLISAVCEGYLDTWILQSIAVRLY